MLFRQALVWVACAGASCMYSVDAPDSTVTLIPGPVGEVKIRVAPEVRTLLDLTPAEFSLREYRLDASVELLFNGHTTKLSGAQIKLHGESSLGFKRKSLKVYSDDKIVPFHCRRAVDEFLLISLSFDKGYINNLIGYSLLKSVGLFYPHFEYVKVYVNGDYQGFYLFIEDVSEAIRASNTTVPFVFRRTYGPGFEIKYSEPSSTNEDVRIAMNKLQGVYQLLDKISGRALVDSLSQIFDLEQYFRVLGVNYLLRNGDYLDEIFFFGVPHPVFKNRIYYRVHPWDYDDLFQPPHGGFSFPGILMYCREDPLDAALGSDSFAYAEYCSVLKEMIVREFNSDYLVRLEERIRSYVLPFFDDLQTAQIMNNFSSSPYNAVTELDALIDNRFSEIQARVDSIKSVIE